jgi:hypothetical protein
MNRTRLVSYYPWNISLSQWLLDLYWGVFCGNWVMIATAASPLADEYLTPTQRGDDQ